MIWARLKNPELPNREAAVKFPTPDEELAKKKDFMIGVNEVMSDKNGLDWVFLVYVTVKDDVPYDVFFALPCEDYSKHSPLGKIESGKIRNYEITKIEADHKLPQGRFDGITDILKLNNIAKELYEMEKTELDKYFSETPENTMHMGGICQ